ncbi:MAG: AI-2E family transporter [Candidatus Limnocylindria bacterium]
MPEDQAGRERREGWWRAVFLIIATIYVALLLVRLLVDVMGGFTQILLIIFSAWLLAFILSPLVAWIHVRMGWPRGVAVGAVFSATLLGSGFLLFYAASSIALSIGEATAEFPSTRARIEGTLGAWQDVISFGRFEPNLVELYRDVEAAAGRVAASVVGDVPEVTLAILGALVLVIILSLYMVADSRNIIAGMHRIVPTRYSDESAIFERTVSNAFGGFLRAQVILTAIQTVLTLAAVLLLDLPYGFLIVAVSALAMLIPFFGPPLALIPPILATAIFRTEWILLVAPLLLVVQTVLVNYLQPRLMREALGMHPILVLVGLLVGAQVAGLWGALFGIPILAVLNVFFTYVVNLRTLEESPEAADDVIEEVRREAPEAEPEELVALAAERVEGPDHEGGAAEAIQAASAKPPPDRDAGS